MTHQMPACSSDRAFLHKKGTGHAAEPSAPLVPERTIALKGVTGRIDHLAVDLARKRLFVAELGNGTVDVIDLAADNVTRRIEGLKEPQGLAYAPAADILAVASAGDGSVRLFHGAELSPAGTVDLGDDADNIRLDARTGNIVVGYGSGGLAVIDPAKASLLNSHPPAGASRGFSVGPCWPPRLRQCARRAPGRRRRYECRQANGELAVIG